MGFKANCMLFYRELHNFDDFDLLESDKIGGDGEHEVVDEIPDAITSELPFDDSGTEYLEVEFLKGTVDDSNGKCSLNTATVENSYQRLDSTAVSESGLLSTSVLASVSIPSDSNKNVLR